MRFSMTRTERLRKKLSRVATPKERYDGWSLDFDDPADVVRATEVLRLKPGFALRAYLYTAGNDGNGFVYALPADAPVRSPEECQRDKERFLGPPRPPEATDDLMEAIDGDGSPWSYLCASILKRELEEYGALWHGVGWGAHKILYRDPWHGLDPETENFAIDDPAPRESWVWNEKPPDDWRPQVTGTDNVEVVFYTYSGLGKEQVMRHFDSYSRGTYIPMTRTDVIAEGPGGYIH